MVCLVNIERLITPSADPASYDPSEVRPENAAQHGAARAPDPTDRYMRVLDRLVDIAVEQIELRAADAREEFAARSAIRAARVAAAVAAAEAAAPGAETGEPALSETTPEPAQAPLPALEPTDLAIQRLSRSARQCMALALRFQNDRLEREAGLVKARAAAEAAAPKPPRAPSRKEQLADLVKDKIEREAEPDEKEDLLSELRERLEDDDLERDLDQYPLDELALLICQELGAGPDGNFKGTGTLIFEYLLVDPPLEPGGPIQEGETLRMEEPRPLHIIRRLNRDQRRKQKQKPPSG
jgi:hypothetical protein